MPVGCWLSGLAPCFLARRPRSRLLGGLLVLLAGLSACGPKPPDIPNEVEAIARRCYTALIADGRTPTLEPAKAMEDGTFLILWSLGEPPNERGSCTVDGSGTVLLLTSNANQPPPNETAAPE